MSKDGLWPWPVHHTLLQRLRSSEYQRQKKTGAVVWKRRHQDPFVPVRYATCQWPQGEPKDEGFHFCGRPTRPERPYCPLHCAIAYLPEGMSVAEPPPEEAPPEELAPGAPALPEAAPLPLQEPEEEEPGLAPEIREILAEAEPARRDGDGA
ncbi:MAG TPA: GcrA family cell cycle regulator [Roseomonas sp.]